MTLTKYILDANGEPVIEPDLLKWAAWMGTGDNKVIAREQVFPHVRVVTTFLGYDTTSDGDELFLWDTLIFGGKLDGDCERYASKDAAIAGHSRWVQRVREA